jgi:hypothetical protein
MNSFRCRCWLSAVFVLFAASAQAERIPITLSMRSVSELGVGTNVPFDAVAPNTLTLQTIKGAVGPQTFFDEMTITNLTPDNIDRMLNYRHGDPPSYEWTITAANASDFGVDWLAWQNHLSETRPSDVLVGFRFFHPSPANGSNPSANGFDRISGEPGIPAGFWAGNFQLHEVRIRIDYYFWHDVLAGLRGVDIAAEIRGDALVVPEPAGLALLSLGVTLAGVVGLRLRG